MIEATHHMAKSSKASGGESEGGCIWDSLGLVLENGLHVLIPAGPELCSREGASDAWHG